MASAVVRAPDQRINYRPMAPSAGSPEISIKTNPQAEDRPGNWTSMDTTKSKNTRTFLSPRSQPKKIILEVSIREKKNRVEMIGPYPPKGSPGLEVFG